MVKSSHRNVQKRVLGIEFMEARQLLAANLMADFDVVRGGVVAENPAARPRTDVAPLPGGFEFTDDTPPTLGAELSDGVLSVTGSDHADRIFVFAEDGVIKVREVVDQVNLLEVPASEVNSIRVDAHAGNDWINIDNQTIDVRATVYGGAGADTLQGGSAGDRLNGGSGDDKLVGRGGNDSLNGGFGDDLLIGGRGVDILRGDHGTDYLLGGDGNDWLFGGPGNDQLFGEEGNDFAYGESGDNLIDGGDGDDFLVGDAGIDAIYGGAGDDIAKGMGGDDRIRGEAGRDDLSAGEGEDLVAGGAGNDILRGGPGNDLMAGQSGNDSMSGGPGYDWLDGGGGNDLLHGGNDDDWLQGGPGTDDIDGGRGDDQIFQGYPEGSDNFITFGLFDVLDPIGDFADAAWDFATDVVAGVIDWTIDKIEAVTQQFFGWISNFDDRLVRLVDDLSTALTNWPWEADFWTGLGSSVLDVLEIAGLGEAWEMFFEIVKPWQRGLNSAEREVAASVFGNEIDLDRVRIDEYSLIVKGSQLVSDTEANTTGYIINSWGDIDDHIMVHELVHVWQYEKDGVVYIPEALVDQNTEGYEYGGLADLRNKMNAGQGMSAYNREQQGDIVKNYFLLRQEAQPLADAGVISLQTRQDMDVYIHFVQEVSSLTPEELDVSLNLPSHFDGAMQFAVFRPL